jgi:PST family polysaccharide transporter
MRKAPLDSEGEALSPVTMSLAVRTMRGIFWSGSAQLLRQLLQVGITALLARLLAPADFGLIGMVVVVTGFVALFGELGFGPALVQKRELTAAHLSTALTVTVVNGLVLMLLVVAAAPLVASFYDEARLVPLVGALALTFPFNGLGVVPLNLLQRRMEFGRVALIEVLSVVTAGTLAVILAFQGLGVWSLVGNILALSLTSSVLAWLFIRCWPGLSFDRAAFDDLLRFSAPVVGSTVLTYGARNLDNLLIGRFLGATALGYYGRAYRLMLYPVQNISWVLGRVLFPAFSELQHDRAKVRDQYLRTIRFISLVTFPLMAGMAVVAPELTRVVYGPRWERTIGLVRILSLVGALQSIGTTIGPVCLSQGRSDVLFRWNLLSVPVVCLALVLGLGWEIEGVAWAYGSASLALWYTSHAMTNRLINLRMSEFLGALVPPALGATVMAGVIQAMRLILSPSGRWTDAHALALWVSLGAAVYGLTLALVRPAILREAIALARQIWSQRGASPRADTPTPVFSDRGITTAPVVAQLKPEYLPLSETFIYDLVRGLKAFTPVVFAEDVKNLDHFPVPHLVVVRTRDLSLGERLSDKTMGMLLGVSSVRAYRYYDAMRRLQPALIHAHFGPTGVMALPIARALDLPLVTTFYGYDLSALGRQPQWRRAYGELFGRGDCFLVEGPFMRQRLIGLGCPEEKIRIQRIAIDLELFPYRPRQWGGGPVILLQVGRLVEKKGYDVALTAFAEVHRRYPRTEFHIIGEGPLRERLQARIGELGLTGAVLLLGAMSRRAYIAHAERCHILIQPSVTAENGDDEGGAPTVLLEMQASGMPIVATRHADIPHVVVEGESAVLVPERDPDALAQAILDLLARPDAWPRMAEAGREFVARAHDLRIEAKNMEDIYAEVCSTTSAPFSTAPRRGRAGDHPTAEREIVSLLHRCGWGPIGRRWYPLAP